MAQDFIKKMTVYSLVMHNGHLDKSGNNFPESANNLRLNMRECCSEIKTVFEMLTVQDLLNEKRFIELEE
jgi:hypothetical protein